MSKKLDQELASAVGLDEAADADHDAAGPVSTPAVAVPSKARAPEPPRRNIALLATLLVMVGAVVALFMVGFKEAAIYAMPVGDLVKSSATMTGRKVRVDGELVPGSLQKRDDPCEYRFRVHGDEKELAVRYPQCVIPDTFRDVPSGGVQVTVEGALTLAGDFEATLVMAKCTSKYDPDTHEMTPNPLADGS